MLEKVISGGQTGADRAGLQAAKICGIPTGGFINKGFKTEDGNKPELGPLYNLVEVNSHSYPVRTLANVNAADATWIFYRGNLERGSALTVKYCKQLNKKHIAFSLEEIKEVTILKMSDWLLGNNIHTINIAGNRESIAPGIQEQVREILERVFNEINR